MHWLSRTPAWSIIIGVAILIASTGAITALTVGGPTEAHAPTAASAGSTQPTDATNIPEIDSTAEIVVSVAANPEDQPHRVNETEAVSTRDRTDTSSGLAEATLAAPEGIEPLADSPEQTPTSDADRQSGGNGIVVAFDGHSHEINMETIAGWLIAHIDTSPPLVTLDEAAAVRYLEEAFAAQSDPFAPGAIRVVGGVPTVVASNGGVACSSGPDTPTPRSRWTCTQPATSR